MGERSIPIVLDRPRNLRFIIENVRLMEKSMGMGIARILSEDMSGFYPLVEMFTYALKWEDRGMTQTKAAEILQAAMDEDRFTIDELYEIIAKALAASGLLRTRSEKEANRAGAQN